MIKVFNTGRQYTAEGQRIAWMEIAREVGGGKLVAFYDGDRHVSNVVRIPAWCQDEQAEVLKQYDECNYIRSYILPGQLEDELRAKAQAFGRQRAEIERVWVLSAYHLPESVYSAMVEASATGSTLPLHDGYSLMVDEVGYRDGVVVRIPQAEELAQIGQQVDADLYATLVAGFGMGVQAVKFDRDAGAAPEAFGLRWFLQE